MDARNEASVRGLSQLVDFRLADAESLPFKGGTFDAVLCECAFCTFPTRKAAASEFERVLKPGRVGISDITRDGSPLPDPDGLLAWIALHRRCAAIGKLYALALRGWASPGEG